MNETQKILDFFLVTGRMERQIQKLKSLYMQDLNLKGADLPILFAVHSNRSGCRMDELGKITGADKSQISRSVKNLVQAGLLYKEKGSLYKARYALTPQGKTVTDGLVWQSARIFEQAHARLSDSQWEAFYSFLEKLTKYMDLEIQSKEHKAKTDDIRQEIETAFKENK